MSNQVQALLVSPSVDRASFASLMTGQLNSLKRDYSTSTFDEWDSDSLTFLVRDDYIVVLDAGIDWPSFLAYPQSRAKLIEALTSCYKALGAVKCIAVASTFELSVKAAEGVSFERLMGELEATEENIQSFNLYEEGCRIPPHSGFSNLVFSERNDSLTIT